MALTSTLPATLPFRLAVQPYVAIVIYVGAPYTAWAAGPVTT